MIQLRRLAIVTTTLLIVVLPALGARAAPPVAEVRSSESERIDAWVTERMAAHGMPGAAVAVVRGGEVVHLAGYGTADARDRPVTPATPFIVGSVSKPFTAAVVAQLVEENLLAWDEPAWPHLSSIVGRPPEGFEAVTIEQLLTHTGGLSMMNGTAGTVEIHEGSDALDRRVEELLSRPLAGRPGGSFEYSNAGPMLLAAVIEQVTGRSFAEELRNRVLDPLGMTGTFATGDDPRAAAVATGHQQWFGRWRPAELPYDDAGAAMGYIGSTASDLASFMRAHLDGHPAVPVTAGEITDGPVTPTGWTTTLDASYGRGWFVDELAGTPVVSHPGSLGHFTAHVLLAPEHDLGIAVLSNASAFVASSHEAQYDLGLGLVHLLLGEEPQPHDPYLLMTHAVPTAAWIIAALLLAAAIRYIVRLRAHGPAVVQSAGAHQWLRTLLPAGALLAVGAGLLAAPLGLARHFYPDASWALTVIAYAALGWAAVRLVVAGVVARRRHATIDGHGRRRSELDPDPQTATCQADRGARHPTVASVEWAGKGSR